MGVGVGGKNFLREIPQPHPLAGQSPPKRDLPYKTVAQKFNQMAVLGFRRTIPPTRAAWTSQEQQSERWFAVRCLTV